MNTEDESIISGCNSLAALSHAAEQNPHIREVCIDSIQPVKILLHDVVGRISLKGKVVEGSHLQLNMIWLNLKRAFGG